MHGRGTYNHAALQPCSLSLHAQAMPASAKPILKILSLKTKDHIYMQCIRRQPADQWVLRLSWAGTGEA